MDNDEFLHHLNLIADLSKKPSVRIILLHNPYTEKQQRIIDSICRRSNNIIGQVTRVPPLDEKADEIQRLILAHKDPFLKPEHIQYVILGQQKLKKN